MTMNSVKIKQEVVTEEATIDSRFQCDIELKPESSHILPLLKLEPEVDLNSAPPLVTPVTSGPRSTLELKTEDENSMDSPWIDESVLPRDPLKLETTEEMSTQLVFPENNSFAEEKTRFKCTLCGKGFSAVSELIRHKRTHTGGRTDYMESNTIAAIATTKTSESYPQISQLKVNTVQGDTRSSNLNQHHKCTICPKSFSTSPLLSHHIILFHGHLQQFQCRFCGIRFGRRYELVVHEVKHVGETAYRCSTCWTSFESREDRDNHEADHGSGSILKCTICGKRFYNAGAIRKHVNMIHNIRAKEPPESDTIPDLETTDIKTEDVNTKNTTRDPFTFQKDEGKESDSRKLHKCSHCDRTFLGLSQVTRHEKNYHSQQEQKPQQKYKDVETTLKCEICRLKFNCRNKLSEHEAAHVGVDKVTCIVCKTRPRFTTPGYLKRHVNGIHNVERPMPSFNCETCKVQFPTKAELDNHQRRNQHVPELFCKDCGKYSQDSNSARQHELTHQKVVQKERCCKCDRWFSSRQALRRHNRVGHHSHRSGVNARFRFSATRFPSSGALNVVQKAKDGNAMSTSNGNLTGHDKFIIPDLSPNK